MPESTDCQYDGIVVVPIKGGVVQFDQVKADPPLEREFVADALDKTARYIVDDAKTKMMERLREKT